MVSADNLCKQFGPRSGPTKCRVLSGSKLFDTLMVFLIEFFEKVDFEKNKQMTIKHGTIPSRERVSLCILLESGRNTMLKYVLHSAASGCIHIQGSKSCVLVLSVQFYR